jgi:hypothetical protein
MSRHAHVNVNNHRHVAAAPGDAHPTIGAESPSSGSPELNAPRGEPPQGSPLGTIHQPDPH